mgnify:FL=1
MGDLDRLDALARAYDTEVHKVRQALQDFGAQVWAGLPDYRDDAIDALATALVPRVLAGQVHTAELTRAYLVECARELGLSTDVPPVDRQAVTTMRGVPPAEVYQRPGRTVWTALSQGRPVAQAVAAGGLRLTQLIGGDLQNAKRVQSRATMRASGGEYYRRVLTGRESCALCVVASTQRYHVKDLLPIHPGCDCSVSPLPPGMGMDQVIDEELLEAVHDAVARATGASDRGARSPDYRDILVQTEHGEYGPVISFKGTRAERRKALRTRTAAAAPPGGPPRRPPAPPSGPTGKAGKGGKNRPQESVEERYARQRRLKSDLSELEPTKDLPREVLESHEIDFLERFEARGELAKWIRRDPGRRSTNDFIWLTNGNLVCELKVTRTKYGAIRSHIQRAVNSAWKNHRVVKDIFMIDLGPFKLSDKLHNQLSRYNANVESGHIRRLFVLSQDGAELTEINLVSED